MTIKTKLIVAVSLLFVMLVAIGGAGFLALSSATGNTRSIVVDRVVPLAQLREVADAFAVDIVDTAHKVAAGTLSTEDGSKSIRHALVVINKNWTEYRATELTETEAALGNDFDKLMDQSKAGIDELLALTDKGDLAAIDEYRRTKLYPLIDPLAEPISKLVALQIDVANAEYAASVAAKNQFNIAMAAMALIALAVVAFAVNVALRGVSRPLDVLRKSMEDLAAGQLDTEIVGDNRADEVGAMARTMLIFKDNALERRALEARAETARQAAEAERKARERQKEIDAANTLAAVNHLAEGLDKLAGGHLTWRIDQPFVAELDRLRIVYNDAIARLEKAMISVGNNARGIAAGSREILSAATDLSRRTEQQAASVEETAAAVEQITTNVSDSASRAAEAGRLVDKTRNDAEASSAVVRQAIDAMSRIENSSKEISSIIGVIDEIAFQTNLLALNAGVEAARAGDAGKGFAVVAQEVRELAQRSAKAAKEIKSLINTSGDQVRNGVDLVARTGEALEAIATQVVAINRNVSAIVEGAREQAIGLKEINHAVNTMDQGTQKNAAMVEESTAASHSLAREAESLFELLSSFKTGAEREAGGQRDRAA